MPNGFVDDVCHGNLELCSCLAGYECADLGYNICRDTRGYERLRLPAPPSSPLPSNYFERKALPLYSFMFNYFPLAWLEVVKVAVEGNKQHNPGEELHWARGKSMDQMGAAFRHIFDHGMGKLKDTDGCYHLAKSIWRLMAELQLICESK
jgi:hypothetical protein